MHPSIAISTDIPRIADLFGYAFLTDQQKKDFAHYSNYVGILSGATAFAATIFIAVGNAAAGTALGAIRRRRAWSGAGFGDRTCRRGAAGRRVPGELASMTVFTGGIGAASKSPEATKTLIKFLTGPEAVS